MNTGLLEPAEILEKLKTCSINPELADKVKTVKDDKTQNRAYYSHIHFLFSLFELNEDMKYILSCSSFIPNEGIKARPFAKLCGLFDLNTVKDLDESGLMKLSENGIISIQPIVKDIVITDLKPSFDNCSSFMKNTFDVCTAHGIAVPIKSLADMLIEICCHIRYDDIDNYLLFIEEAVGYLEASKMLGHVNVLCNFYTEAVTALPDNNKYLAKLYYIQCLNVGIAHGDYSKAIPIAKKALELADNIGLEFKANMHHNLGFMYYNSKRYKECRAELEKAIVIYRELGISNNDTLQTLALLHDVNSRI